jgi:hypothetical protein
MYYKLFIYHFQTGQLLHQAAMAASGRELSVQKYIRKYIKKPYQYSFDLKVKVVNEERNVAYYKIHPVDSETLNVEKLN